MLLKHTETHWILRSTYLFIYYLITGQLKYQYANAKKLHSLDKLDAQHSPYPMIPPPQGVAGKLKVR